MAQCEFKFNWIKRDDVANETTVRFTVHVGENRDVAETGPDGAVVNRFVRDAVLEQDTVVFDGLLDDEDIRSYLRERLSTNYATHVPIPEQARQVGDARRSPRVVRSKQ